MYIYHKPFSFYMKMVIVGLRYQKLQQQQLTRQRQNTSTKK